MKYTLNITKRGGILTGYEDVVIASSRDEAVRGYLGQLDDDSIDESRVDIVEESVTVKTFVRDQRYEAVVEGDDTIAVVTIIDTVGGAKNTQEEFADIDTALKHFRSGGWTELPF